MRDEEKKLLNLSAVAVVAAVLLLEAVPSYASNEIRRCRYVAMKTLPIKFSGLAPTVEGTVNGKAARMLVDTGAMDSYLFPQIAKKAGLKLGHDVGYVTGIGGTSTEIGTKVDELSIGPFHVENIRMGVISDTASRVNDVLLGARFLFNYDLELSMAEQYLRFFQPENCSSEDHLAYWDENALSVPMTYLDGGPRSQLVLDGRGFRKIKNESRKAVHVEINGKKLRALIDSGAMHTTIFSHAVQSHGLNLRTDGSFGRKPVAGVGKKTLSSWIAQFDTFQIGDEMVKNGRVMVVDHDLESEFELVLGADFLRAHRVLFAVSQNRFYFSYIGGTMFYTSAEEDVAWYMKAAEFGNADAQYHLGQAFDDGTGAVKDRQAAKRWYLKSAEQGDSRAQTRLGMMYQKGDGGDIDYVQAASWYEKAAAQDAPDAQYLLASMYQNGQGVDVDIQKAVTLYRKAAENGNRDINFSAARNLYIADQFSEASEIFERLLFTKKSDYYAALWLYLAKTGAGESDGDEAIEVAKSSPQSIVHRGRWPEPLADYYLKKIDTDAVFEAIKSANADVKAVRSCEASYYIAEYHFLLRSYTDAIHFFTRASESCPPSTLEASSAKLRIEQLIKQGISIPKTAVFSKVSTEAAAPINPQKYKREKQKK
jgi:TPR repeat protein